MSSSRPVFAAEGLSKSFGGTPVLKDVSVQVDAGEILAVVGQNGSGKSTLVKIMSGYHSADWGEITVGRREAFRFVHQNLGLIPELSIVDNLALERGYGTAARELSTIRWRKERRHAREMLASVGLAVDPETLISELSMGERALVALARALGDWDENARLLVLDEPTVSLSQEDTERLFAAVRDLATRGIGVLCVLHSIHEVLTYADRVLVLRDGSEVTCVPTSTITHDELLELMVGEPLEEYTPAAPEPTTDTLLQVRDLSGAGVDSVDFDVKAGEVLGVAGIVGSGREALMSLIQGSMVRTGGTIVMDGTPVPLGIEGALRTGIVAVPANRERDGCVLSMTVQENILLPDAALGRRAFLHAKRERAEVCEWIDRLQIRPPRPDAPLSALSGGNQQKVVFAKWLRLNPRVLLLEDPTQGVDVRAKRIMYEELVEAARNGAGVVLASSDSEELARICDKVVVLRDGRVGCVLSGRELTEDRITAECLRVASASSSDMVVSDLTAESEERRVGHA
jgi:ribose transport system ATP-binding protein